MALTERKRAASYQGLSGISDEEVIGEMHSNFASQGVDEPASKDLVRAEIATVRTEIQASANRIVIWAVRVNTAMVGFVLALTRGPDCPRRSPDLLEPFPAGRSDRATACDLVRSPISLSHPLRMFVPWSRTRPLMPLRPRLVVSAPSRMRWPQRPGSAMWLRPGWWS